MALLKRESESARRATVRADKLESVDPLLDLNEGNTLAAYRAMIAAIKEQNSKYNTAKAAVDGKLDKLEAAEAVLDTMSVNMLTGVRTRYGADSAEYEQAGGTRTSERKKPVRKPKAP